MSAVTLHFMRCDSCGFIDDDTESAVSVAASRRIGRESGWERARANPRRNQMHIDLCPTCSTETAKGA